MAKASENKDRERDADALRFERDRSRRKLTQHLEMTPDEAFLQLAWNINALQSGRAAVVQRHLEFPPEARTTEFSKGHYVPPWDLELVVNERLVAKPLVRPQTGYIRINPATNFGTVAYAVHLACKVADFDIGLTLKRMNVMREMSRIGHRQFEWQRGFANGPQIYRWHYLFNGPKAQALFEERHGLTTADLSQLTMVLYHLFSKQPAGPAADLPTLLEMPPPIVRAGLALISAPIERARMEARQTRVSRTDINYQPSILRSRPIVAFDDGRRLLAPLHDLLLVRGTEGIYYDLAGAPGDLRNEVADRFETYTRELLNAALPDRKASEGPKYRWRGETVVGPDVMLRDGARLAAVFECKARKMSLRARYAEAAPGSEDGVDELAKGVFQVWKFFSHVRRGLLPDPGIDADTAGVVLTLDNWMTLSLHLQEDVLARALRMIAKKDPEITITDQRRVVFASISDLELTLPNVDGPLLDLALKRAVNAELPVSANLWGQIEEHEMLDTKPYALADRVDEVWPWLRERRENQWR